MKTIRRFHVEIVNMKQTFSLFLDGWETRRAGR